MLADKPYFTIRIKTVDCRFNVVLNKVPVFHDYSNRPVKLDVPVNQWITAGENTFEIYVFPDVETKNIGEKVKCNIGLHVRRNDEPASDATITAVDFDGRLYKVGESIVLSSPSGIFNSKEKWKKDDKGDVNIGKVEMDRDESQLGLKIHRKISLDMKFPKWKYFDSDEIPASEELDDDQYAALEQDLLKEYKQIWNEIRRGNVHSIVPLFAERNEELDKAFYNEPGQMERDLTNALGRAISSPDRELFDLEAEYAQLHLFPNQRLARIVGSNGKPVIVFNYSGGSGAEYYDIVFRKSGNKWIITR